MRLRTLETARYWQGASHGMTVSRLLDRLQGLFQDPAISRTRALYHNSAARWGLKFKKSAPMSFVKSSSKRKIPLRLVLDITGRD